MGNEDVDHAYLSLSQHKTQYPDFIYMEPLNINNESLQTTFDLGTVMNQGYFVYKRGRR